MEWYIADNCCGLLTKKKSNQREIKPKPNYNEITNLNSSSQICKFFKGQLFVFLFEWEKIHKTCKCLLTDIFKKKWEKKTM